MAQNGFILKQKKVMKLMIRFSNGGLPNGEIADF